MQSTRSSFVPLPSLGRVRGGRRGEGLALLTPKDRPAEPRPTPEEVVESGWEGGRTDGGRNQGEQPRISEADRPHSRPDRCPCRRESAQAETDSDVVVGHEAYDDGITLTHWPPRPPPPHAYPGSVYVHRQFALNSRTAGKNSIPRVGKLGRSEAPRNLLPKSHRSPTIRVAFVQRGEREREDVAKPQGTKPHRDGGEREGRKEGRVVL